jgi:hypothetical protein
MGIFHTQSIPFNTPFWKVVSFIFIKDNLIKVFKLL